MTITPLAFINSGVPLATDADLKVVHPGIIADLWQGETTYEDQLSKAFDLVSIALAANGIVADQLPDSATNIAWAKEAVINRAFMLIFADFFRTTDDRWDMLYQLHKEAFEASIDTARLDYDSDDDGTIDDDEEGLVSVMRFTR